MLTAWEVSKVFHDVAAHVRYASVYGAGLVELRRFKEALAALDEAINTEKAHSEVGYPSIAINSKIDALRGLQRYTEALALANEALAQVPNPSLEGPLLSALSLESERLRESQSVGQGNGRPHSGPVICHGT